MSKLSHLNDAHAAWSADPSDANLENLLKALTRLADTIVSRYPLEDRENAASAAVFRLWGTLDRFKGRSSFSTWSYAVISNAYRDDLRKQTRRKKMPVMLICSVCLAMRMTRQETKIPQLIPKD